MKVFFGAAIIALSIFAQAGELDQDTRNQGLNGTVVVRVDQRNQSSSVLKTESPVQSNQEAITLAKSAAFKAIKTENVKTELDAAGGASSWYWYCGNQYPTYLYWYGYTYYPVYTYNYSYYTYYYYSWYRW